MSHNQQMINIEKNFIRTDPLFNAETLLTKVLRTRLPFADMSKSTEIKPLVDLSVDPLAVYDSNTFEAGDLFTSFNDVVFTEDELNDLSIDLSILDPIEQRYSSDIDTFDKIGSMEEETTTLLTNTMSNDSERDQVNLEDSVPCVGSTTNWTRFGNKKVIKYSEEYHHRRSENNRAVKRSRQKADENKKATELKMAMLVDENQRLIARVDRLTKELSSLKSSCAAFNQTLPKHSN